MRLHSLQKITYANEKRNYRLLSVLSAITGSTGCGGGHYRPHRLQHVQKHSVFTPQPMAEFHTLPHIARPTSCPTFSSYQTQVNLIPEPVQNCISLILCSFVCGLCCQVLEQLVIPDLSEMLNVTTVCDLLTSTFDAEYSTRTAPVPSHI